MPSGQFRMEGCKADVKLPDMDLAEAKAAGAKTLVIGVANRGGVISPAWKKVLVTALEEGFDLASGLHNLLRDEGPCRRRPRHGAKAPRRAGAEREIPDRQRRAAQTGKRCLAVGTDCSVGKMYTSLAMDLEMKKRGRKSSFRATGQTGILITGDGVPLDAVIADFMAGSIEWLTPDNDDDHWDMIEGQGSLFHVSYSGVTMALIHGGAPDALILSHEPTRSICGACRATRCRRWRRCATCPADRAHRQPQGAGRRHLGQHRRLGRGSGDDLSRRGGEAHGPARGRSVPAGGRLDWSTRWTRYDLRHAGYFRLAEAFTISRGSRTEAQVLTVRVMREGVTGHRRMRALCALRRDAGQRRGADRGAARRHLAAGPAGRAAAGGRAQRRRLRAVGLEGETRRHAGAWEWPGCRSRAGGDRLYPVARHARQHARGGGEERASPASEDQARHARRHAAAGGRARRARRRPP
jgi:hypothetical protein